MFYMIIFACASIEYCCYIYNILSILKRVFNMTNGNNSWKLLRYSGGPIIPKNWTLLTYLLCLIFSLVSTSPILIFNNDQIEKYLIIITTLVFVPGVILQKMEKKFISNDFYSSVENLFKRKNSRFDGTSHLHSRFQET